MKDPKILAEAQDRVWVSGDFQPKETDAGEMTYCNLAVSTVLGMMGCHALDHLTAGAMVLRMREHPDWEMCRMQEAQMRVNQGSLIVAGLTANELGQTHAHVCTLTPGVVDFAGKWGVTTPVCMNLGRKGTCFRSKGVNWAFQIRPDFFVWKESL
jgi:hypothetical protein